MNKTKLIKELELDFIDLADNYMTLLTNVVNNKKSIKKIRSMNPIYLTDYMIIRNLDVYLEKPLIMEPYLSDNENLWDHLICHLWLTKGRPLASIKISDALLNHIVKRIDLSDSYGTYAYQIFRASISSDRMISHRDIIDYNQIMLQLCFNPYISTFILHKIEKFYQNPAIDEKIHRYWYIDKIKDNLKSHPNYKKTATMVLNAIHDISKN